MELQPILQGFVEYLEKQNFENGKEYQVDTLSLRANIFAHSTEFKKYISEELNIFENIQSMSISEILSMEVENGQLVKAEDNKDKALSNKTLDEIDLVNEITETELETIEETEKIEENELLETINQEENNESDIFIDILNDVLQDETLIQTYDIDGDNSLNKEEISNFLNSTKTSNENQEMFSLDNLFFGIEQIKKENEPEEINENLETEVTEESKNEEILEENEIKESDKNNETFDEIYEEAEEEVEEEIEEELDEEIEIEADKPQEISNAPNVNSSNSGTSNGGNYSNNSNNSNKANSNQNYENMSKDALNEELAKAESEVQTKQTTLSSVLNGNDDRIKAKNEEAENLYNAYLEELKVVDVDMAEKTDTLKQNINTKEQEISTKEQEISNQEITVSNSQTAYDNAVATKEQLQASLSSLQSADTSNLKQEEVSDIGNKKTQLEAKITEAEQNEKAAKEKLENDKKALEDLKTQKQTLDGELQELNTQKTELDAQIAEKYPQIKEMQDKYNTAKNDSVTLKSELSTNAKNELAQSQEKINKINSALNALENKETKREFSLSPLSQYNKQKGEELVNAAKQMLNKYGSSTGYCARGVSRTMKIAYNENLGGHGYQWDSNMDQLVAKGMFVEATEEFPTSGDFNKLPAGAVVCWENTGVQDGSGGQYGHVCVADGNGGEISDHYQSRIYLSVGGRSDNYRIFIPV